ncbi:MAG: Ig-like domain-containing protein [Micrococcales bacterium]|nr:Ig-like domain-containing protein [Micrococcales bacterium]
MSRRARAGVASGAVVALTAATLGFYAVSSRGETVHEADLADGGVWVTSSSLSRFGRFNKPVRQLDLGVSAEVAERSGLDVHQDGATVLGQLRATSGLVGIDIRTGKASDLGISAPTPQRPTETGGFAPSTVDLRAGTVAMVDPRTGKVWAQRVGDRGVPSGLPQLATSARPVATVGAVAAMTVGADGAVHAVSGATGRVVTVPVAGGGFGKPVTATLPTRSEAVDITAVGGRWVVLDRDSGRLHWADGPQAGAPSGVGASAGAALQQAGPERADVAVQSPTATVRVSLDDGAEAGRAAPSTRGRISRPVVHGGCVHSAWAQPGTVQYAADCGESDSVTAQPLDNPPAQPVVDGVAFRTNRGQLVLNDLDSGGLWDLDSKPVKVDNWDALMPPPDREDKNKKKDKNLYDDSQLNQPPTAEPDTFSVRPGRTSKLHVLDNDTDPSGSVLAISAEDVTAPDVDGVSAGVAADGQTIDITVPAGLVGRTVKFGYAINNGKSPPALADHGHGQGRRRRGELRAHPPSRRRDPGLDGLSGDPVQAAGRRCRR